jgi:hypothetical protein
MAVETRPVIAFAEVAKQQETPMTDESRQSSASLELCSTESSRAVAPPWTTEALLVARALWARWALLPLVEQVRVERGRAGTYSVVDFVLVLLTYALSGASNLKAFYAEAAPITGVLSAAWQRDRWPSRSAVSRFLDDVSAPSLEAFRTLF